MEQLLADVRYALGACDELVARLGQVRLMKGCCSPRTALCSLSEIAGPESGRNPEKADTTMRYLAIGTDRVTAIMKRLEAADTLGELTCAQVRVLLNTEASAEDAPSMYGDAAVAVAFRAARDAAARLLEMEGAAR